MPTGERRGEEAELGRLMGEMQAATQDMDARFTESQRAVGTGSKVAESIPQAEDTAVLDEALTAAAAHWSLNRWAALWRMLGHDAHPTTNHDLERSASTMLVLDGFVGLARESGFFVEVAVTIERLVSAIRSGLPDFGLPSEYPALRNASQPDQG